MRVALFDLLAGGQATDFNAQDPRRIGESVRRELERLLNTRRTERGHGMAASVIDYGIGDWSTLYADREQDQRLLSREIRKAISHFEPRLELESVEVNSLPGQRTRMTIRAIGHIRGLESSSMAFVMNLGEGGFEVRHERFD